MRTEQRNAQRRATYHAKKRLEQIRQSLRDENTSWGELAELQALARYIRRDDVELLEPAGVPEVYITAIYDNGGKSFDRYCAYLNVRESRREPRLMQCFVMSDNPQHPKGVGMHSAGFLGRHNGKRIRFSDLPAQCQETLNSLEYQEFPQ